MQKISLLSLDFFQESKAETDGVANVFMPGRSNSQTDMHGANAGLYNPGFMARLREERIGICDMICI